jgi:hypothetical protein
LFRAESGRQVADLSRALGAGWADVRDHLDMLARVVWFCWPLWLVQYFQVRSGNLLAPLCWPWPARAALYLVLFYLTIIFGAFHVVEFIYFQF